MNIPTPLRPAVEHKLFYGDAADRAVLLEQGKLAHADYQRQPGERLLISKADYADAYARIAGALR